MKREQFDKSTTNSIERTVNTKRILLSALVAGLLFVGCGSGGDNDGSVLTSQEPTVKPETPQITPEEIKQHTLHLYAPKSVNRGEQIHYTIYIENKPIKESNPVIFQLTEGNISLLPYTQHYLSSDDYKSIENQLKTLTGVEFNATTQTLKADHRLDGNISFTIDPGWRSKIYLSAKPLSNNIKLATSPIKNDDNSSVETIIYDIYAPVTTSMPTKITLTIGEPITVYTGDSVNPLSSDAQIEVIHTIDNNTKQVILISGSAELIRGDYYLTNIAKK